MPPVVRRSPHAAFVIAVCLLVIAFASFSNAGWKAIAFIPSADASLSSSNQIAPPVGPTLGNYSATNVALSANTTVIPDVAPGGAVAINVSASRGFNGTLVADSASGVVRVTNASPAGTYTITVRGFDSGGADASRTFTLTVQNGTACTGSALFDSAADVNIGTPRALATADFNNDGKQDIAIANFNSATIRLGDGAGGFTVQPVIVVGTQLRSVVVGDFNNDGKQDFAVSNSDTNAVAIRLGDGAGNFSAPADVVVVVGTTPQSMTLGDFNGDGKQDLAVVSVDLGAVSIRLGDGLGGFSGTTAVTVGPSPNAIAVGDFNHDGNQDFAVARSNADNVLIRLGDGLGGFTFGIDVNVGANQQAIVVGDFNNDNKQDIAVSHNIQHSVSIRLGDGLGGFSGSTTIGVGTNPRMLAILDANNDGNQDFATANFASGDVSVRLGDGVGGFSFSTDTPVGSNVSGLTIGDFNGDGRQDFAAGNAGMDRLSIRLGRCVIANTPSVTNTTTNEDVRSASGLVISRNVADGPEVTHFKISSITNGVLLKNNGSTAINNGDVITFAEGNAGLKFTPAANLNSSFATFSFQVQGATSAAGAGLSPTPATATITVNSVNDAPSFTKGSDQTVNEDGVAQTVNWATAISAGPADESAQTLTFQITNNTNPALFAVAPAISSNGTLTYTPVANGNGPAMLTINLKDNGGTANGGADTSASQTFNITVTPVNDAPSFTKGADQIVNEDASTQTVNWVTEVSRGPIDEGGQSVTFQVTNNTNGTLFSGAPTIFSNGVLTYTPAANANGSAIITVNVKDNGGTANGGVDTSPSQTFTITVNAVNDSPSFTKGANQTVNEDAGAQTVNNWATAISAGPADESGQTLTFQVTGNTNTALFSAGPAISSTGALTYTPAADANGSATITINLKDNGGTPNGGVDTSASQTFTITVNSVNDVPSFTKGADQTVNNNASAQTVSNWATASTGPANESGQTLTFQITNNTNAALFSSGPAISSTGTLTYIPASNTGGTATITVNLRDNGGTANGGVDTSASQTFTITVTPVGGFINFAAASSDTTESSGSATVTVNRTGVTSTAVTVDYATNAHNGLPCSNASGAASPKCDFTTALGTLSFAAGETNKTITVLISQDSLVEGPETMTLTLSNQTGGAALGTPSTAAVVIADDATEPPTNPIDDVRNFVRQHYHDFLNREPDPSGWDFWTNQITSCGSDAGCNEVRRIDVSASFFLSIEFQQSGYLVERFYKVGYGDVVETSTFVSNHQLNVPVVRFSEFLKDTQRIGQGVIVLAPGWEQALENNKQAYALEFVQTSRFTTALPTTLTPDQFVDRLNQNTGGVLSLSERTAVKNVFGGAANTSNVTARAQAVRTVADDPDLLNAEFNRAFVLAEYFGYLRRNPNDAPESTLDYTGYDFWLTKLNQFNGNYINAEMVKAFLSSIEYRQRFGP